MIFFVWSLVVDAINYTRRARLSSILQEHFRRDQEGGEGILMRRLLPSLSGLNRYTSAPVVGYDNCLLYRTEGFEVLRVHKKTLRQRDWNIVRSEAAGKALGSTTKPIYVHATVKNEPHLNEQDSETASLYRQIEDYCCSLAWKSDDDLEVLFLCGNKEAFESLTTLWADRALVYKKQFDVNSLEIVDIDHEFVAQFAHNMPQKPTCIAVLEKVYLDDISASRDLSESLRAVTAELEVMSGLTSIASSGFTTPVDSSRVISEQLEAYLPAPIPTKTDLTEALPALTPTYSVTMDSMDSVFEPIRHKPPAMTPNTSTGTEERCRNGSSERETEFEDVGRRGRAEERRRRKKEEALHSLPPPAFDGRRFSLNPQSGAVSLRRFSSSVRRRSLSPLSVSLDARLPSVMEGISGWRRSNSFRSLTESRLFGSAFSSRNAELVKKAKSKPPNILIYTGHACQTDTFLRLTKVVEDCLRRDSYAVYFLTQQQMSSNPWTENTVCLIVADTETLEGGGWEKVEEYFLSGGKVLFICQNRLLASLTDCKSTKKRLGVVKLAFSGKSEAGKPNNSALGKDFEMFMKRVGKSLKNSKVFEQYHAKDLVGGLKYSISVIRENSSPLILYMQNGKDCAGALFTDATLDSLLAEGSNLVKEAMERLAMELDDGALNIRPSHAYLLTPPSHLVIVARSLESIGKINGSPTLFFNSPSVTVATHKEVPVVMDSCNSHPLFNSKEYFRLNKALHSGRSVLFLPVVGSTMDVMQTLLNSGSKKFDSFAVIARYQTKGKGRSGNRWLSPLGCAMFSIPLRISLHSKLGKASGFIQHILALSVVDGIRRLVGIEDCPLRLKWPNDIYHCRSHKLGGVLVNCSLLRDELVCVLGCGLNVANSNPTLCLNDLLPERVGAVSVEGVVGAVVTRFEELVADFQDGGPSAVLPLYYRHWLHSREEVTVSGMGSVDEKVYIRGLDCHGFLEVRSKHTGRIFSVQPDGNTFDMMKNLIKMKH